MPYNLALPLALVISQLLSVAAVPDMWKRAVIVPVFNKKDGYRQQNVRQRQKLISIIDYDV